MFGELFVGEILVNVLLQNYSTNLLISFFQAITLFGHPLPWIIIAAWLFWIGKEKKSFALVSVIIFSSLISGILKFVIARPRPEGLQVFEATPTNYSMPSGHSVLAGAIYGFFENKLRGNIKWLLLILTILTGVSRLFLGVHYLSDVFVGLILGYFIGKIVLKLEKKIDKSHLKVTKFNEEKLLLAIFLIAIILIIVLPSTFYLGFALIGYYFGFVIYRDSKLGPAKNKKISLFFGTIILGIISYTAFFTTGFLSISLFILSGIFVTLIWPFILHKTKL